VLSDFFVAVVGVSPLAKLEPVKLEKGNSSKVFYSVFLKKTLDILTQSPVEQ